MAIIISKKLLRKCHRRSAERHYYGTATGGDVTLTNCTVSGNSAVGGNGGGIINEAGGYLSLDFVLVSKNSAFADSSGNFGSGGGIENDGNLTVNNSTFTNNLASGGDFTDPITEGSAGGAIDSQGASLTVSNSTFSNNEAVGAPNTGNVATWTGEGNGGAINSSSPATIT